MKGIGIEIPVNRTNPKHHPLSDEDRTNKQDRVDNFIVWHFASAADHDRMENNSDHLQAECGNINLSELS